MEEWQKLERICLVGLKEIDIKMVKEFITKDSGKRQHYKSGMQRDLQLKKPRFVEKMMKIILLEYVLI